MKNRLFYASTAVLVFVLTFFTFSNVSLTKPNDLIVLSKDNTIVLSGVIEGETASVVISEAKDLNKSTLFGKKKPIYLFVNTPGGSIQTGLEMIEALSGSSRTISTVSLFSASMGFQVVQNLGERLILKNGVLMSHRAKGEFSGEFGGQSPSQIDNRYKLWLTRIKELDEQTVSRTNGKQTLESYQKAYANELWLTGTQAVEQGYADRIVEVRCDSSLDGVTTHAVEFLGLHISYDTDNCPINTSPMNIRITSPDRDKISSNEKETVKAKFMEQYANKQKAIVPAYW